MAGTDPGSTVAATCYRVCVGVLAAVMIVFFAVLLIMLTIIMAGMLGEVSHMLQGREHDADEAKVDSQQHDDEEGESGGAWLSVLGWILVGSAVLGMLAQVLGFLTVVCLNKCLGITYVVMQVFFTLALITIFIVGLTLTLSTKVSEAEKEDVKDSKANAIIRNAVGLIRHTMQAQRKTRLGGIEANSVEQENECCGFLKADEYWNADTRLYISPVSAYGGEGSDEDRKEAFKSVNPGKSPGGTEWHYDCLKANHKVITADTPLCYAPKSCCKGDVPDCNSANLRMRDFSSIRPSQLKNLTIDKPLRKAWWKEIQEKSKTVEPVFEKTLFSDGCLAKMRHKIYVYSAVVTGVSGVAILVIILTIVLTIVLLCTAME